MLQAIDAREVRLREELASDWTEGLKLAEQASVAIRDLLDWMSRGRDPWQETGVPSIVPPVHPLTLSLDRKSRVQTRFAATERRASYLLEAEKIISALPEVWRPLRAAFIGQNVGEPEKTAFVHVLAEAWTYIAKKPPSKGMKSGFADFVCAAWEDAGGLHVETHDAVESFTHAINKAAAAFKEGRPAHWHPEWLQGREVSESCETPLQLSKGP